VDVMDSLREIIDDKLQEWGSRPLLRAWMILATPNWEDGQPILNESDIVALKELLLDVRSEIKALQDQPQPEGKG